MKKMKIVYYHNLTQHFCLEVYIYINWVGNKKTCKSTLAYIATLGGYLIS